jgi:toxin ParE1/3/4
MKRIIVLPFAELDIKDSADYYGQVKDDLKESFIATLTTSFNNIRKNPLAYPKVKHEIRKCVISDFPFCIYFVDQVDALYIIAVFHSKRNPKVWKKRKVNIKR